MAIKGLNDDSIQFLYDAVLELKDEEEAAKFFEDLCTVNELKSLSQRLVVAKMLTQHCVYSDIVAKTGASTATISRVNRSLSYGAGGYDDIFERLEKKEQK